MKQEKMIRRIVIACISLAMLQLIAQAQSDHEHRENFIVEHVMKKGDCSIAFVTDKVTHARYVIKQINDPKPDEQFLLVIDAVACYIAQRLDIPMNHVEIYPACSAISGMMDIASPATLHTYVSREALEDVPDTTLDLHQRRLCSSGMAGAAGCGVTHAVIHSMTTHPQLARIVAFDTFVGNADRSLPNIFYDTSTNSYCGIDLSASWCTLLGEYACVRLEELGRRRYEFTCAEKEALALYGKTLEALLDAFPPERIVVLLEEYARKAGFAPGNVLYDQDVHERILFHKGMIEKNYYACEKLVRLLHSLIY